MSTTRKKTSRRKASGKKATARPRIDPNRLAKYLAEPRTEEQVANTFKLRNGDRKRIAKLPIPDGMEIFVIDDRDDVTYYVCVPQQQDACGRKRDWAIRYQPDLQPYIQIQFPNDLTSKRIKIVPLSDVHYGARACSEERFKRYIDYIARSPDVYTFLNGDLMENAIDGAIGGAAYESKLMPAEQIWGRKDDAAVGLIELLRPIAHKILWALPGNHEWRTWKKCNIDPLRIICDKLGIPYFDEPIFIDVFAWGHKFTIHCQHGSSGGQTKGGKLNAASKPGEYQEAIDFLVMGHVHDSMANPEDRIVRVREYDDDGNLTGFRLEMRQVHVVICPSFHGFFGTYGARAGYSPGSWGSVALTLYHDGNCRASE